MLVLCWGYFDMYIIILYTYYVLYYVIIILKYDIFKNVMLNCCNSTYTVETQISATIYCGDTNIF